MIQYRSTRDNNHVVNIDQAILAGLASDGGLYVPTRFPQCDMDALLGCDDLASFASQLLQPFFQQSGLHIDRSFCEQVFSFPMPMHSLSPSWAVLELFHGPTLSFKDFGAQFFAACLNELVESEPRTVMVATSGDTGSAVAAALHGKRNLRAVILFPKGKISARQRRQICCWGGNVLAIEVEGAFDDCQRLVKAAFQDPWMQQTLGLTTANSINIARLLPQQLFYAYSSIQWFKQHREKVNIIVPSGNIGNVTACYWARQMGFPIGNILIATNANQVLGDYLSSGEYQARDSIPTLANAMDVGNPSNLERLQDLFGDFHNLSQQLDVTSIDDQQIKASIRDCYQKYQYILCPHSATAFNRLQQQKKTQSWLMVATAHPAKFETIVEPIIGQPIPIPQRLQELLERSEHAQSIIADLSVLQRVMQQKWSL